MTAVLKSRLQCSYNSKHGFLIGTPTDIEHPENRHYDAMRHGIGLTKIKKKKSIS